MSRVKRGKRHLKRRRGILGRTKGFEAGRKKLIKLAKTAATKAGAHAYRDRRVKKRANRGLWQVRINAAVRPLGMSYSQFMGKLKKRDIQLDRKALSTMANDHPAVFEALAKSLA